jgi:hypothetical protein
VKAVKAVISHPAYGSPPYARVRAPWVSLFVPGFSYLRVVHFQAR